MDRDRPGGDASTPGDLPSDFGERTAARQGGRVSPSDQPPTGSGDVVSPEQRRRFSVGASYPSAAERTRSSQAGALRDSHGLEVVHVAERSRETRENQPDPTPGGVPGEPVGLSGQEDDSAARMMREIEEAVAELRRQFAGRLISLQRPTEPPEQDNEKLGWLSRVASCDTLHELLSRIQQRARRLAAEKPKKTAAVLIAFGLAFAAALRLRKSH